MYIQNRRESSNFNGCSPLQLLNGLIGLKPAIAYFAYTNRYGQFKEDAENDKEPPHQLNRIKMKSKKYV